MAATRVELSCIIPVYNAERFLHRCLDSVVKQTFQNFEVVLVDDGSPDDSGTICDEYAQNDSRFHVIHKANGGAASARNIGLDYASGQYICFIDSDDWVEPDFFEQMYAMVATQSVDIAVCGFWGCKRQTSQVLTQKQGIISLFSINGIGGYSPLKICSRNLIEQTPKCRYNESFSYLEDTEFFYRLFKRCNSILWDNRPLYHYELNENSVTQTAGLNHHLLSAYQVYENLIANESDTDIASEIKRAYLNFRALRNMHQKAKFDDYSITDKELDMCRKLLKQWWKLNMSGPVSFQTRLLTLLYRFFPVSFVSFLLTCKRKIRGAGAK